jgi:soluble lytic murein transglycosylase-like protein
MNWILVLLPLAAGAQGKDAPHGTPQRMAMEQQEASIRRQAQAVGARLIPWSPAPVALAAEAPCEPIEDALVSPMIDAAAKTNELQPQLLRAVIEQESAFRPCAVSVKGAMGLMQLMPATVEQLGVDDPFDARKSIEAGARFLKQLLEKYQGNLSHALGAYNAGPGAVDAAGGIPDIPETRDYVDAILRKLAPTRTDPPSIPKPKPIEN